MTAPDFSELPLDAQFLFAVNVLNDTAEPWPQLADLATLHIPPTLLPKSAPDLPSLPAGETRAEQAISMLDELSANAAATNAISRNEELEDISTPALKVLLLPYLLATAHAAWQGEPAVRLRHLIAAGEHLSAFFAAVDRVRLLSAADRARALPGEGDDEEGGGDSHMGRTNPAGRRAAAGSGVGGVGGVGGITSRPGLSAASSAAAAAREEKIARFRAERAAARRLDGLIAQARREAEGGVEDAAREAAVEMIGSAMRRGLDMRHALATETQLLSWAERQRARGVDPRERAAAANARARQAGPPQGPVPGMPQSFRIVNEREAEREKVFRPSHSLPTYTIEEWGQIEAEMLARKQTEQKHKDDIKAKRKEEEDSDGEEAVNRDTMEKRQWDDWKDEHNRGSGNTMR